MFTNMFRKKRSKYFNFIEIAKNKCVSYSHYLSGRFKRQAVILKLKKADIILAKPKLFSLSPIGLLYRILLRSDYVHSMLYIGNGEIIHTTTKDGVSIHKVPRKIFKKDRYTIYRAKNLNSNQRSRIVAESLKLKDMKMDFMGLIVNIPRNIFGINKSFSKIENNRIWCSKLIYQAYSSIGIKLFSDNEFKIITSENLSKSNILEIV